MIVDKTGWLFSGPIINFKMLETFEQVFKGVFLEYWSHGVLES
jgi:hypothetical protein